MDIKTKLQLHRVEGRISQPTHFVLVTTEGDSIADLHIGGNRWPSEEQTQRNARRLVACWNACAGIPTEMLESADSDHQPALYAMQAKHIGELEQKIIALKGGEVANANAH